MNCLICKTPILVRDSFFWRVDKDDKDESDGCVHDDCLIREAEFAGKYIEAGDIFRDSEKIYKTLPKV